MQTHSLIPYLLDKRLLKKASRQCMQRKSCPGIDGVKWKHFRYNFSTNLNKLHQELVRNEWQPSELRLVQKVGFSGKMFEYIIPNISDRIVHRHLRNIIEKILDNYAFKDFVSGFRKKRSRLTSLRQAFIFLKRGNQYVVDIDIKKVSSNVSLEEVMNWLSVYISDGKFLQFVRMVLSALPSPLFPGSGLTPLLINLRLVPIDIIVSKMSVVRFADNYCFFCRTKDEAELLWNEVEAILIQNNLEISKSKSKVLFEPNIEDLFLI